MMYSEESLTQIILREGYKFGIPGIIGIKSTQDAIEFLIERYPESVFNKISPPKYGEKHEKLFERVVEYQLKVLGELGS